MSVPVPVTVYDLMDDSDEPDPEMIGPKPEPMTVVPYDPDIVVKEEIGEVCLLYTSPSPRD